MVSLLRIDDRLIHGLVVVSWTNQLKPDIIVCANDAVAKDSFQAATLKLAKPAGVDMYIWALDETLQKLDHPKVINKKVLLITKTMDDALYLCDRYDIKAVNIGIGGTSKTADKKPVLPEIFMNAAEFETAKKMHDKGIEVFAQLAPTKQKLPFDGIARFFS